MKSLSNSDKLKAFIVPNMTDLITLFDKNIKSAVYTRGDICGIYCYLYIIGAPTTLTTSYQRSHHFFPLYSIKNDTASLQPVIAAIQMIQKSICKCCGNIVHKDDACIIRGPKFLPPSLRRNMNQFNDLHVKNQINHQESGTANFQHLNSNPGPLLTKTVLGFQQ